MHLVLGPRSVGYRTQLHSPSTFDISERHDPQPRPESIMRLGLLALAALSAAACAPAPAPTTGPVPQSATGPLYMPRDIRAAFQNGTRSPNGRPGPNYWQNRARYDIRNTALPPDRTI